MEPYPSINELLPPIMLAKLPPSLVAEITERYATLGEKYLTPNMTLSGRPVNGMMYTDRMINMQEEIVDACFCAIGQAFKDTNKGKLPSENLAYILDGLVEIYTMISLEIAKGGYA